MCYSIRLQSVARVSTSASTRLLEYMDPHRSSLSAFQHDRSLEPGINAYQPSPAFGSTVFLALSFIVTTVPRFTPRCSIKRPFVSELAEPLPIRASHVTQVPTLLSAEIISDKSRQEGNR